MRALSKPPDNPERLRLDEWCRVNRISRYSAEKYIKQGLLRCVVLPTGTKLIRKADSDAFFEQFLFKPFDASKVADQILSGRKSKKAN